MPHFLATAAFRHYVLGLAAVLLGAFVTQGTGSMLPLAMGSAVAVMTTASLVAALRERAAVRRQLRLQRADRATPSRRR